MHGELVLVISVSNPSLQRVTRETLEYLNVGILKVHSI